jgi:outer membrane protein
LKLPKKCGHRKGAFQPTLRGFYNLSTRVGYADRIVGTELDALNPTSVFGFVEEQTKMFCVLFFTCFRKGSPFLNQFSDNKGQSFGAQISIPVLTDFQLEIM